MTPLRDERDFAMVIEDMPAEGPVGFTVVDGRVLGLPAKRRRVKLGDRTTSIEICIHGRLVHHTCSTCEYEAPRVVT